MSYRRQARAKARRRARRPAPPVRRARPYANGPVDVRLSGSTPWSGYWDQMFPGPAASSWVSWKRLTSGDRIARRAWETQQLGRRLLDELGVDAEHRGLLLGAPDVWTAACADCTWLGRDSAALEGAAPLVLDHTDPAELALWWHGGSRYDLYRRVDGRFEPVEVGFVDGGEADARHPQSP